MDNLFNAIEPWGSVVYRGSNDVLVIKFHEPIKQSDIWRIPSEHVFSSVRVGEHYNIINKNFIVCKYKSTNFDHNDSLCQYKLFHKYSSDYEQYFESEGAYRELTDEQKREVKFKLVELFGLWLHDVGFVHNNKVQLCDACVLCNKYFPIKD